MNNHERDVGHRIFAIVLSYSLLEYLETQGSLDLEIKLSTVLEREN